MLATIRMRKVTTGNVQKEARSTFWFTATKEKAGTISEKEDAR